MAFSWVCCLLVLCLSYGTLHGHPVGDDGSAWERSGKFQGDITFKDGKDAKNGLLNPVYYWPDATLVYKIDSGFASSERSKILAAMDDYEARTCIRFREATSADRDFVYFQGTQSGCFSNVGRSGGLQIINYGPGCFLHGTIMHEMLHALGFYHQQSATDRDDYVTIVWDNIISGYENNFDKYPSTVITDFGVTYDYGSVMHYGATAFTSNGRATIVPKDPNAMIGQRNGLSEKDITKLEQMYGCRK